MEACFQDLVQRQPESEHNDHLMNDDIFAKCMDAATNTNRIAFPDDLEKVNACVEELNERIPGLSTAKLNETMQSDELFAQCLVKN